MPAAKTTHKKEASIYGSTKCSDPDMLLDSASPPMIALPPGANFAPLAENPLRPE